MTTRAKARSASNNLANGNKNICGLAVAQALGVHEETRYLHTVDDVVYAARKRFTVRSRGSQVNGKSVGKMRSKLAKLAAQVEGCKGFIIRVKGHVLLLNTEGKTTVDSDPRQRDARKITHCFIVY